ncbi:FliC/FljB family flagellin [Providencia rettgeri]|uniref:FliC/FljB family flagellin n=1 Tax=Providencia rettgeri TaxID=587 RepID=UPI000F7B7D15|nr:FliC/FljB family flagellin [Providencia rettgeri]MBV2191350.1 FliC/FljB family flagellin [Providencia rettgeri]
MAQVINTNILSLTTQNNLNRSQGVLGTAIERLSSGSRINSAKDDAAGQAIANRFTANVKGLTQASRNANDGISIAQTAEGAVNEINDNLQRIRELTVQAKNGSNSVSDTKSIQEEVDERLAEITRISEQTQFNGINVLSEGKTLAFQVGSKDGENIALAMDKIDLETLNVKGFKLEAAVPKNNNVIEKEFADEDAIKDLSSLTEKTKVTVDKGDAESLMQAADGTYYAKKGDSYFKADVKVEDKDDDSAGKVTVTFEEKNGIKADQFVSKEDAAKSTETALKTLDDALNKVDTYRSKLGAFQNRMQSTINNLNNSVNNLSAARSRIQDADFATEVSNMSRGQILQQAGTAVLAQANQVPQGVLSLLR